MVFSVVAATLFSVLGIKATADFTTLKVEDVKIGTGETLKLGDTATFNFRLTMKNGTKVAGGDTFGSDNPPTFDFKEGSLIPGWTEGLVGLKEGGRRRLEVPSSLAYGQFGSDGIPPNTGLIFLVELVEIINE